MPGLSAEAWRDEGEGATLGNWLFHCLKKAPPQQNPILEKVSCKICRETKRRVPTGKVFKRILTS